VTAPPRRTPPPGVRATAPLRLDFAGGWTDVPPFATREGGLVVNAAIDLRVEVEFEPGREGLLLRSEDLGQAARVRTAADLLLDGTLDLHKAAVRMLPPGPGTLRSRSRVPPGSGLGSSGALDVALVAALARVRGETLSAEEIAREGWHLEAVEAGNPGGRQDQYAAALGGFHQFEFLGDEVRIQRLEPDPGFAAELESRLMVCYTGQSRVSGATIARVMAAYEAGVPAVTSALHAMRSLAREMAAALVAGDLSRIGLLLSDNWAAQQRLDPGICTPEMAALERAMRQAGALGGKAAGAGAGGSMFFLMGDDPERGRRAALAAGAELLPLRWSPAGVEIC
jgi:D-glycero-alpha-D-manno-heptose-7-phosphate kinase